jgi:prefoldin subunit 5
MPKTLTDLARETLGHQLFQILVMQEQIETLQARIAELEAEKGKQKSPLHRVENPAS